MKLVSAIIKPCKLEAVRATLTHLGFQGVTVTHVRGYGRQQGQTEINRRAEHAVHLLPKLKIEVVVPTLADADRAVEAIVRTANTGRIGDGKVFVSGVEHTVGIRTGEIDESAL